MKGRHSEALALEHLQRLGFQPLAHNLRLFNTEIDLMGLSASGEVILYEIKSGATERAGWQRYVSDEQAQRLRRVLELLQGLSFKPVRLHLVVVDRYRRQVLLLEDFLK